jgi:hypothetical protein
MNEHLENEGQGAEKDKGHFLDIKLPIGWLLTAYGLLLGTYGLLTDRGMYAKSLGFNLNAVWGGLMLVIGAGFLLTALIKKGKAGK